MKLSECLKTITMCFLILPYGCSKSQIDFDIADVIKIDKEWIFKEALKYLTEQPVTVTASFCPRSQGGIHDYYSEGDYWWPDSANPNGPYIRRDGLTNPDNFVQHRLVMRRMSIHVATLTAAYVISGRHEFAEKAIEHLKAWFINKETQMNPNMEFSQAIKGVTPGRGIGIIDAIHLVEAVQAVIVLRKSGILPENEDKNIKQWFHDFLQWITTHPYGIDERETKNNHSTCWVMQVAEYATLTQNDSLLSDCRKRFKEILLPTQVSENGSFPLELQRTKPYGYSLFNLDAMAVICKILSAKDNNLWTYELQNGVSMKKAMGFMFPYIQNKSSWPYKQDVMYWDDWPARQPALLFAGIALNEPAYITLWKMLPALPESEEGIRNFPIRMPILWIT
jgi:Alginate lyase